MLAIIRKIFNYCLFLLTSKWNKTDFPEHSAEDTAETVRLCLVQWAKSERDQQEFFLYFLWKYHGTLRHAYRDAIISSEDIICNSLKNEEYWNIKPLLEFYDTPWISENDLESIAVMLWYELRDESFHFYLLQPNHGFKINPRRNCLYLQLVFIYVVYTKDANEEAVKALKLIWNSIGDIFITYEELLCAHKESLDYYRPGLLKKAHEFYEKEIVEECCTFSEPRSLQHICRTVIRGTLSSYGRLHNGVGELYLPRKLMLYLRLKDNILT